MLRACYAMLRTSHAHVTLGYALLCTVIVMQGYVHVTRCYAYVTYAHIALIALSKGDFTFWGI